MALFDKESRQCKRKSRHDSETDARIALVENHGKRPEFCVYLCPHCEFWHVGHAYWPKAEAA